ncbi:tyrosine-type recombinase/integrase [Candidatus Palauibacter sp.]|uniref:tyrosine-type recombinase/integrase n=1 Tax=Candidatus Palauibacter sp. TaxID=3101350 RepID=UPI003B52F47E
MSSQDANIPTVRKPSHAAAHVAGIAPGSRASLNRAARALTGHDADGERVPWHTRPAPTLEAMRAAIADSYKPATANASLAAVRGAIRAAWLAGDLEPGERDRLNHAARNVKGESAPGAALDRSQVRRLFEAAADQRPATAARDAALLALLYGLGLRRAEAAAATLADLDTAAGSLKVRGKGRRERLAYLHNGSADAVADWIERRGSEPGPILAPVTKAGEPVAGRGMTGQAIAARVRRLADRVGLGNLGPHVLRRSYATELLDGGNDLAAVAACMGHRRLDTTARYDRRGERAKRAASATLAVPYAAP